MAFSVLPIIDLQTGQVQFTVQGRWHTRYIADPAHLERLVSRSSRRPVFDPRAGELVVFVAAAGQPDGRRSLLGLPNSPAPSHWLE